MLTMAEMEGRGTLDLALEVLLLLWKPPGMINFGVGVVVVVVITEGGGVVEFTEGGEDGVVIPGSADNCDGKVVVVVGVIREEEEGVSLPPLSPSIALELLLPLLSELLLLLLPFPW